MARRFALSFLFLAFTALAASAGGFKPYEAASFEKAIAEGKTVVVHVHADWCPVCKRQQTALEPLAAGALGEKAEFVRVDFDKDTQFLTANKIPTQSVILVFKGGAEVERIIGTTNAGEIESTLSAAIG